jgi:histidyl-tRNA synthetase
MGWEHVTLNLGLTRGVYYHTGMVFEIEHGSTGEERQLCGGGRYDGLIAALGGRKDTPAAGFSFGLERLLHALEDERIGSTSRAESKVDVLVVPVSAQDLPYAVTVAEQLRKSRLAVEMAVRDRSVAGNFRYADKRKMPFAVVVGSEERAASVVVLKDLTLRTTQRLPVSDAALQVRAARSRS